MELPDLDDRTTSRRVHLLLALLVLVCFSPGLDNFFSSDDFSLIFDAVKSLNHWPHFLHPVNNFLRHTVTFYFCSLIAVFGVCAVPFFVASITIHVANFLLVSRFITRVCGDPAAGLLGALFWALNYKHAEVVFRQYAVADSLALLFGLCALLLLLRGRGVWAALVFIPALFAKENAMVLPALASLLLAHMPHRAPAAALATNLGEVPGLAELRRSLRPVLPLWGVTAVFVAAELYVRRQASYLVIDLRAVSRLWDSLVTYLGPDAVTICQVYLGGRPTLVPVWLALTLTPLLGLAVVKVSRIVRFALLWTCVTLLPTVFLIHQTSRYHYVPLVGVAILVGHGLSSLLTRLRCSRRRLAHSAVVVAYLAVTAVLVIGVQVEERDHAFIGELHRQAAESFQASVLPGMSAAGPDRVTLFVRGDTMHWAEQLLARNERPWWVPSTYKWVFRRPFGMLGLASTYGFVTYCAHAAGTPSLFVRVSHDEASRRLRSGDVLVVVHDTRANTFAQAAPAVIRELAVGIDDLVLRSLEPGRFDPSFTGTQSHADPSEP